MGAKAVARVPLARREPETNGARRCLSQSDDTDQETRRVFNSRASSLLVPFAQRQLMANEPISRLEPGLRVGAGRAGDNVPGHPETISAAQNLRAARLACAIVPRRNCWQSRGQINIRLLLDWAETSREMTRTARFQSTRT